MTAKFQLIRYGRYDYGEIPVNLVEIPAHFDAPDFQANTRYSLHTEYSYGPRKFDKEIYITLKCLKNNTYLGIPQLWFSNEWAKDFFIFIQHFINDKPAPEIVEIHPPFRDYCPSISIFLKRYQFFENEINKCFPETKIFIENRKGSLAHRKFLVENAQDIIDLLQEIAESGFKLQLVLDIPTFISSIKNIDFKYFPSYFESLKEHIKQIGGIHIWGREKGSHMGNLDSLFNYDPKQKNESLRYLSELFDDGNTRYIVPEVNGTKQAAFMEILSDLNNHFELL